MDSGSLGHYKCFFSVLHPKVYTLLGGDICDVECVPQHNIVQVIYALSALTNDIRAGQRKNINTQYSRSVVSSTSGPTGVSFHIRSFAGTLLAFERVAI